MPRTSPPSFGLYNLIKGAPRLGHTARTPPKNDNPGFLCRRRYTCAGREREIVSGSLRAAANSIYIRHGAPDSLTCLLRARRRMISVASTESGEAKSFRGYFLSILEELGRALSLSRGFIVMSIAPGSRERERERERGLP